MARFTGYGQIGMPTAMRYTGFGQDPNYMYSFRQAGYNPQQSMMGGQDAFRSLRESLAYRQAGMEGKQRMEKVVSMGLPANTDINKIQRVGYDPEMRRPVYVAPRPQAWGTYGSVGTNEEERPIAPRMPAGGPQPAQKPSPAKATEQPAPQPTRTPSPVGYIQSRSGIGFSRTPMGFTGEPASFTYGGQYFGMAPRPTATSTPIPFPELNTRNYFSSTMGGIKFPYATY